MKLIDLKEAKERTLIGLVINGFEVTHKTKDEHWPGDFNADARHLTSLEGAPLSIGYDFTCHDNYLTSLVGGPETVGNNYYCQKNRLSSLEGAPEVIGGNFDCSDNVFLTSLKDIHKHIKVMNGCFLALRSPIKSHVLGLLYIKGCLEFYLWAGVGIATGVITDNQELNRVQKIVSSYLPNKKGHKGVFECQCELQDANLDDYAQL